MPTIDGTVYAPDETTQQGADVLIIDSDTNSVADEVVTDSSGYFSSTVADGPTYHAAARYDDGTGNLYNARSEPFITSSTTLTFELSSYTAPAQSSVNFDATSPHFDVTIDSTNSPVGEGSTLTVDYSVTNTGDARVTQGINLNILAGLRWSTDIDWDNSQAESFVHHDQPTGTDWASADTVELGLPTADPGGALEAYWPLDEDSGTTAHDVSGNGRDGTVSGATRDQPGILGATGYSSDGGNDYIETNWTGVGGSQNRTFECWVNTSIGTDQSIVTYGHQTTSGGKWLFRIDEASTAGTWVPRVEVSGGFLRGSTHIADGAWHHLACVLEGTDVTDHTLYVDGVAETVDGSSAQAVNTDTAAEPLWLLRRPSSWAGSGGRVLDGLMDEPRMYSRALSAAEIQTHALGDTPTGSLTTAVATATTSTTPTQLRTTASLGGGSIDVVVNEDTNQDGTVDNQQTVTLAGGTDETTSLSGFTGGSSVDYWTDINLSVSSATDTAPTLTKLEIIRG